MFVIYILVFLKSITFCVGLNCYTCDSATDPDCLEFFVSEETQWKPQPCNYTVHEARFCVKTTGAYGGTIGIRRFCSMMDLGTQCQNINWHQHDRLYRTCVYSCWGDSCNSGADLRVTAPLLGGQLLVVLAAATYF